VFSLLFTPFGRYIIIGSIVLLAATAAYVKIRSDAVAEIEAAATADALRRTSDAVRAGDAVDIRPDRLRDADGHNRD
jgi:hypothetical protein